MICRNAIQKILFVIKYVLDWYKNQEMCYKIILGNGECLLLLLTATKI